MMMMMMTWGGERLEGTCCILYIKITGILRSDTNVG